MNKIKEFLVVIIEVVDVNVVFEFEGVIEVNRVVEGDCVFEAIYINFQNFNFFNFFYKYYL